MERMERLAEAARKTLKEHGSRLIHALSFLLVGALAFEAGWLQKSLREAGHPVVVEVTAGTPAGALAPTPNGGASVPESQDTRSTTIPSSENCVLVGSKKSNKYHHPSSRCAKQIKLENQRCFSSPDDARAKGYLPGCLE